MISRFFRFFLFASLWAVSLVAATPRETIAQAVLSESAGTQRELIASLLGQGDEAIAPLLTAWRQDAIVLFTNAAGEKIPVTLTGEKDAAGARAALRVADGQPLLGPDGQALRLIASEFKTADHTSALRRVMKTVLDVIDIAAPSPVTRKKAIQTLGQSQKSEYLPALQKRLEIEAEPDVALILREAKPIASDHDEPWLAPWPVPITCSGWPLPQFGTPHRVQCSRPPIAAQEFQNSVEMPE